MKAFASLLMFALASAPHVVGQEGVPEAGRILDRYLAAAHPKGPSKTDRYDPNVAAEVSEARQARLAILAELRRMPTQAVCACERVLFERADSRQRREIVGMLGDHVHTRECAELLHRVIQDVRKPEAEDAALYEELVRASAVHGLRMMARCTDRGGGKRIQRRPDFEPEVRGLVPYLISAASDKAERVRVSALWALADSRDPAAVAMLRDRLQDPSREVRFHAACFLTEFQDASGLPEMRKALDYLRTTFPENRWKYYLEAEMLLASFERITGKSFGAIPMNPSLCSLFDTIEDSKRRFGSLLDAWSKWWDWEPGTSMDG